MLAGGQTHGARGPIASGDKRTHRSDRPARWQTTLVLYVRSGTSGPADCALATTGATRSDVLPEIPAISEICPASRGEHLVGVACQRNTSPSQSRGSQMRSDAEVSPISKMKARVCRSGSSGFLSGSPSDFVRKVIAEETTSGPRCEFAGRASKAE